MLQKTLMRRRGFSLIELLVVVGIIVILIALMLPSLNKVRRSAKETKCAAGLRSMVHATLAYATENQGYLPDIVARPTDNYIPVDSLLYYQYRYWRDMFVTQYGVTRPMWYSPTNGTWNQNGLWSYSQAQFGDHCVTERVYFCSSVGNGDDLYYGMPVASRPPESERPLFTRRLGQKTYYDFVWGDLNRMFPGKKGASIDWVGSSPRTGANHVYGKNTDVPGGSHMAHIDGSVDWTPGGKMKYRTNFGNTDTWW